MTTDGLRHDGDSVADGVTDAVGERRWLETIGRLGWVAKGSVIIAVTMPVGMVLSRLYLGMHYPTDAVAGVALGAVVLAAMWRVVHRTLPLEESPQIHDHTEFASVEAVRP